MARVQRENDEKNNSSGRHRVASRLGAGADEKERGFRGRELEFSSSQPWIHGFGFSSAGKCECDKSGRVRSVNFRKLQRSRDYGSGAVECEADYGSSGSANPSSTEKNRDAKARTHRRAGRQRKNGHLQRKTAGTRREQLEDD